MDKHEYISKLLNELVLDDFYLKKEELIQKNLTIKDFINEDIYNEKFPNIKLLKSIYGKDKSDICGFYALFFTLNYIKYILNKRDIYYIYKNTNRKSFYKFYKNFLSFFISNNPELENYEKIELNKEGSLERHHLDFILKNNLLFKYLGKKAKYNTLFENNNFEFEWFDFVSNNFALSDISKIKKLNNIFKNISQCSKNISIQNNTNNENKIYFLYIGLIEHWFLIIYDSFNKNYFFEIDSFCETKDIIKLKYLDQNEIKAFIDRINEESKKLKKEPPKDNSNLQFNKFIQDMHKFFYKLNYLLLKSDDKEFNLGLLIIEERCNAFIESINNLNINKEDILNELLILYNWFAVEYHPKRIREDFLDMMKELSINSKNCNSTIIKNFFSLIKELKDCIKNNIKLIEMQDIKEILEKGLAVFEDIVNI